MTKIPLEVENLVKPTIQPNYFIMGYLLVVIVFHSNTITPKHTRIYFERFSYDDPHRLRYTSIRI